MKKFLHSLLMLFMGITTVAYAQQEEASTITAWDGANRTIMMEPGDTLTFEYTASSKGTLYIYADNQSVNDNVPLSFWGGWYHEGTYVADSPLQEAGDYENGVGVYGWISVMEGDVVRFTITAAKDSEGQLTQFTLKSMFNVGNVGDSWENPIALTQNKKTALPVYTNNDVDYLADLSYATFCRFVAPSDGVASIFTSEYLIYYVEEDLYGSADEPLRYASQDTETNDHEFAVKKDKAYIVIVPNSRPTEVTFKMTYDRLGLSEKFPVVLEEFPADLNLVKGDNYYKIDHELIGDNTLMDVAAAAGWNGTITYMEGTNWGATESEEITADAVAGNAATFVKNVDTRFLNGNAVVINFNIQEQKGNATLTLRAPAAGESFNTAIAATLGENTVNGPARDYWFAYTAETDSELSFTSSATLKHVNYIAGVELMVPTNVYRVNEGETIYVCVTAATEGDHTFSISSKDILAGDYCDKPIYFELGQDITIEGRGIDNFHSFTAEANGFAVFTSEGWTVHFREECGGRRLNPMETTTDKGSTVVYTYKLPVTEGHSYIVEVETVSEDVTITTSFEAAVEGDVCATAIKMETLGDTVKLAYEFEVAKWYTFTADKEGFYTVNAKLGYAANMTTKIGDCDAKESNAGSDDNANNAYMGGYKAARVYLKEGQALYIYTKTGRENDETEFSAEFYLVAAYSGEARPGEDVAVAVEAVAGTEYTILKNDAEGYEQWYTYTIPAADSAVIEFSYSAKTKYTGNNLSLYKEDMTSMSRWDGDFTQENLTNDSEEIYGKRMVIPAADEARTIYIKVSTANAKFYPEPVVWQIIGKGNTGDDDNTGDDESSIVVETVDTEAAVIYDLMGRRVENPTKGIYIINGVKRIIK